MSEPKKSRRRFLADMLFIGGGMTAAAFLAKSVGTAPAPAISPTPAHTPPPPQVDGEMTIDNPPEIAGDMIMPECEEPAIEGKMVVPEGGAINGEVEVLPSPGQAVAPPPPQPKVRGRMKLPTAE